MNQTTQTAQSATEDQIREKILHILKVFPKISPSMMQIGIGSSLPAYIWRGKLAELIEEGLVVEDIVVSTTPSGRSQTYTVIRLSSTDK